MPARPMPDRQISGEKAIWREPTQCRSFTISFLTLDRTFVEDCLLAGS